MIAFEDLRQFLQLLEDRGEVTTRPRSGHYVKADLKRGMPEPPMSRPGYAAITVNVILPGFILTEPGARVHERFRTLSDADNRRTQTRYA